MLHYPGRGIRCIIDNAVWLFGSRRLLEEHDIVIPELPDSGRYSAIFIACGGRFAGTVLFSSQLKKSAAETIDELHKMGIKCVILSGDRAEPVSAAAKELNIDEF